MGDTGAIGLMTMVMENWETLEVVVKIWPPEVWTVGKW